MSAILIPDCYNYIIGLSRTNCECYTIPADASTSLSGLYLDELESLAVIQAIADCDNNSDVWTQMERARQIAITMFQADTNALMMKNFKLRRQNFSGGIGRAVTKGLNSQTMGSWYGVRMMCQNIKSGVLHIKNIGAIFNVTDTVLLHIYNNLGEEVVAPFLLQTLSDKHQLNTVDIELPLHSSYVENLEYYFIYQSAGIIALNNDLKCNCGGFKPFYDTSRPYFHQHQREQAYMWSNWMMVGGFSASTLPAFGTEPMARTTTNLMYGLTFDVELKCKISETLCYESLDFESNNLAAAMALAIQHKAASIMGAWIVNSGNLSRANIINTEQMIENIKAWDKTYSEMTTFISEQVDTTINGCFVCRDIIEMARGGILA